MALLLGWYFKIVHLSKVNTPYSEHEFEKNT